MECVYADEKPMPEELADGDRPSESAAEEPPTASEPKPVTVRRHANFDSVGQPF